MRIDGMVFTLRLRELPCQPTAPGAWQPVPRIAPVGETLIPRVEQRTQEHTDDDEPECGCHPLNISCGVGYVVSMVGTLVVVLVTF